MTIPFTSILTLAAFVAAGCATETGPSAAEQQADLQAIQAVVDQELAMANAGNPDAFIAQFAVDATAMPPNEPAATGAAFRDWVRAFMDQVTVSGAAYHQNEIFIEGDLAVHEYSFSWTITPSAGGEAINESGKGIHILRRQSDGSWRISHDIWSSDTPVPQM